MRFGMGCRAFGAAAGPPLPDTASSGLGFGLRFLTQQPADAAAQDQLAHRRVLLEIRAAALVDQEVGLERLVERFLVRAGVEGLGEQQPATGRWVGGGLS